MMQSSGYKTKLKMLIRRLKPTNVTEQRETYSLYIFAEDNRFRELCVWFVNQKWFDNVVLLFIALNCITLAMERPNIPPTSTERYFLATANNVFTAVFTVEMLIKVVSTGMFYGHDAYFTSGWNIMDGSLVIISIIDLLMSLFSQSSPKIFGILRVSSGQVCLINYMYLHTNVYKYVCIYIHDDITRIKGLSCVVFTIIGLRCGVY
ncbi:PREDICTED: voltage-dependent T-type calcium channel subunit alpha-1I-like [Rhagoletis zephyria]|uniref:voltage-dependent T-type calcium channel subunit alpha-1I-like n=1 Tax=Rhagoletis zephyria TaxID=28612 RepID=UPI0008118CAB|nr:PREDICTED: voltage-dependent T-type calcium channel subunit alpha-1I-like [Rhagoletis zephyria]